MKTQKSNKKKMKPFFRLISTWGAIILIFLSCNRGDDKQSIIPLSEKDLTPAQISDISALESLGYVQGDQPSRDEKNVTIYNRDRAYPGFNIYISEHVPWVFLINMEGVVLHKWEVVLTGDDLIDALGKSRPVPLLRRAHLFENGEILILIEKAGLIRLDHNSKVIWHHKEQFHHDFDVGKDGTIYVLGRKADIYPAYNEEKALLDNYVAIIDINRNVRKRISLLEAFEQSSCCTHYLQKGMSGDVFHSNTLELLDGRLKERHSAFRAGNLLMSWRKLNAIGILNPKEEKIVWSLDGHFQKQHHPTILDNGRILVFDNFDVSRGRRASRVIEIDPFTEKIHWEFHTTPEFPFFTRTGGSNVYLPNGNVLISETCGGRAIEVTPEGEVVWVFVNPARVGEDNTKMARIFGMQRLPEDFPLKWLSSSKKDRVF